MEDNNTNDEDIIKDAVAELKAANDRARDFLDEVDKKIMELDIKYAQINLKDDINKLKMAKDIIKKRYGVK